MVHLSIKKGLCQKLVSEHGRETGNKFLNTLSREPNHSLSDKFSHIDEKIILTMTSYPGRINEVLNSIKLLFANTIKPDRLVLNLSTEEFPNKERDLP